MEVYEQIIDKKENVIQQLTEQVERMEQSFDQALKEAKITESKLLGDLAERSNKYEQGLSDLKMNYENKITSLYAEIDDVTNQRTQFFDDKV